MKNNIDVEICTCSLESCLNAQLAGASRVELCSGMYDGGTTPSAAMIRMAREKLSIQLYVMIRPRGGDFLYSDLEFEMMKEDIRFAKACRADGVVLGILNAANAGMLIEAGVDAIHLSGKSGRDSEMEFRNPNVFMGGVPGLPEYEQYYSDVEKIKAVLDKVQCKV